MCKSVCSSWMPTCSPIRSSKTRSWFARRFRWPSPVYPRLGPQQSLSPAPSKRRLQISWAVPSNVFCRRPPNKKWVYSQVLTRLAMHLSSALSCQCWMRYWRRIEQQASALAAIILRAPKTHIGPALTRPSESKKPYFCDIIHRARIRPPFLIS